MSIHLILIIPTTYYQWCTIIAYYICRSIPWTLDQFISSSSFPILIIDPNDQVEWARKTHDWMESMWKSPDAGKLGVCLIPAIRLNHSPVPPFWKDVVFGYRELAEEEVRMFGRLSGEHQSGVEFLTFTAEPAKWEVFIINRKSDSRVVFLDAWASL